MPIRTKEAQEIVNSRLLYTALMKAVLIAWTQGCPIAKPPLKVYELSANKDLIIRALLSYFDGELSDYGSWQTEGLDDEVEQIAPVLRAITAVHESIKGSSQKFAPDLIGETENKTVKNLIDFFTNTTEREAAKPSGKNHGGQNGNGCRH